MKFNEVISKSSAPTMRDIADILAEIAPPGQKHAEKTAKVKELFATVGGGTNPQGHGVWDDLPSYKEF